MDEAAKAAWLDYRAKRSAFLTYTRSLAMLTFAREVQRRYIAAKTARSLLDFDDLIDRTAALLTREQVSAWVHYKLDQGIDHILVDEAQADTAPVRSIGDTCVELRKTVFPPAYTRFVQKGDTSHECAAIAVAAVWFFKMSPLSETAVSKTEYAFRPPHAVGLKTIFYNIPFIGFKVFLHGALFLCYRCKDRQINR
jgi:hypothetical protein